MASRLWPSLSLMVCSFTNQVLAQLDVLKYWKETTAYKKRSPPLPKELDEKVAKLTFLHSVRRSMSPLRDKQIFQASRLKTLSRAGITVIARRCRSHRPHSDSNR